MEASIEWANAARVDLLSLAVGEPLTQAPLEHDGFWWNRRRELGSPPRGEVNFRYRSTRT
jgi:hypothetical protein